MNVKIQSVKFDADKKLLDFIEAKIAKLNKFYDKIVSADVILKLNKDEEIGNKCVIVTLDVPSAKLVSEKQTKSFEESFDECMDALKRQLEKHKEKFDK